MWTLFPNLEPPISAIDNDILRIGKSFSWRKPQSSDDHLRDELERLALVSPHLLGDLGFTRDVAASVQDTTVWRKGQLRVVVARSTRSAIATIN